MTLFIDANKTEKTEVAPGLQKGARGSLSAPELTVDGLAQGQLGPKVPRPQASKSVGPAISLDDLDAADAVVQSTLAVIDRKEINRLISNWDQLNGPVQYTKEKINTLLEAFDQVKKLRAEDKDKPLNFDQIASLSQCLEEKLPKGENYSLINCFPADRQSFEDQMRYTLDRMNLTNGSVVRILEPGNNDQATPMHVAQQIHFIQEYAKSKKINLTTQVLIMGKGGHATTATFRQFAEIDQAKKFSGTTEAESLGTILKEALSQRQIAYQEVNKFTPTKESSVQIKLAKESTNTGENVDEASLAFREDENPVRHVFVTSAIGAATRQALTFAQQYSSNRNAPLDPKNYDTITSIPLARSSRFIEQGLTNLQAVTELYAGLAERVRLYAYAFSLGTTYIPAFPIDTKDLEDLYATYALLSGTSIAESRPKPLKDLLAFFQGKFTVMEKAIPWNKEPEAQVKGTDMAVRALSKRYYLSQQSSSL